MYQLNVNLWCKGTKDTCQAWPPCLQCGCIKAVGLGLGIAQLQELFLKHVIGLLLTHTICPKVCWLATLMY